MAKDRPPSFQFYPRDFLSSAAVAAMSPEARGGYVMLLCHAWLAEVQGHLPDDDEVLAALSGLGERWPSCRTAIRRAFAERDGGLVQERMVEERDEQLRRRAAAQRGAQTTNSRRYATTSPIAERAHSVSLASAPASASSTASSEESKSTPSPRKAREEVDLQEWMEAFPEFYQAYPRHIDRAEAEKAYSKVRPRTQATCDLIFAGLEHWAPIWATRPKDKIEYPSVWLNKRRYLDATDPDLPPQEAPD